MHDTRLAGLFVLYLLWKLNITLKVTLVECFASLTDRQLLMLCLSIMQYKPSNARQFSSLQQLDLKIDPQGR